MDFSELDDALDEGSYIPSFAKAPKTAQNKPLLKNSSAKSIESGIGNLTNSPRNPTRTSMFQLHKQTRQQVTTFEDVLKQNASKTNVSAFSNSLEKPVDNATAEKRSSKLKDQLNINNLLDQDEQPFVSGRRNLKPPLSRKNQESKSVVSRKNDQLKPLPSASDINSRSQKPNSNLWDTPIEMPSAPSRVPPRETSKEPMYKQGNTNLDGELKKVFEEQLQQQRQLSQKIIKQEQALHKTQIERLKKMYEEELRRKIELKDLEMHSLKQNYELKIRIMQSSAAETKQIEAVAAKLTEGVRALERAQQNFKLKSSQLQRQTEDKSSLMKSFQDLSNQKEKSIIEMIQRLENKQKQFHEEKTRMLAQIDRERVKQESNEHRIYRKEKELEERYLKKQRSLLEEIDRKEKRIAEQQSALTLAKTELQQERASFFREKQEGQVRNRRWEESRTKHLEQIQLEKTRLITREVELNSHLREWDTKSEELLLRQKELQGKLKLIELQRKKWEVQRDMKRKVVNTYQQFAKTTSAPFRNREQPPPAGLEKSLKQLKDEYLRNLGHI